MKEIGTYQSRKVYWFNYNQFQLDQLPTKNWLCLATSDIDPNDEKFEKFVRYGIDNGILEFKGHGLFDEIMVDIEISKSLNTIDIATTWHNDETLADAFWQCFFVTTLPTRADLDNISIVCTDIEGNDRITELKGILKRFENGWIPD
jgi:hypothetical protein